MDEVEPQQIHPPSPEPDSSNGRGLGIISPSMFEPSRWEPSAPVRKEQYLKFVNLILGRIRANESNATEARLFFEMLKTDGEPGFWAPVSTFLRELGEGCTAAAAANNEPYMVLHSFLTMEMRERSRQVKERSESREEKAMTGLPVSQQEALAATIFGRETSSANRTDAQNRFLKSHLEAGYPQHVMAIDEAVAARSGKVIQRDGLGLPMDVGTTNSSRRPSETERAGHHSSDHSSSSNDPPESEPPEPVSDSAMPSQGTPPRGERPPVRYHVFSGWAKQTKEESEQRGPRMHPRFEPEASHYPIVIKGFDPAVYAALQPKAEPMTSKDVSEQLRQMDLGSRREVLPVLQPFAGNVARSLSMERGNDMAGNAYRSPETTDENAVASQADSYEIFSPTVHGFDLSKTLPDPSSVELDAAFLARRHTSSSDESEEFQSQVIPSSFLVGSGNDSLTSTVQSHHSLLSELLEGAASATPDSEKTADASEEGQKQPGPSSSANRPRPQREDSALPPDFFGHSGEVIRGGNSPLLRDEQEKLNSSGMHMDWYDRLP